MDTLISDCISSLADLLLVLGRLVPFAGAVRQNLVIMARVNICVVLAAVDRVNSTLSNNLVVVSINRLNMLLNPVVDFEPGAVGLHLLAAEGRALPVICTQAIPVGVLPPIGVIVGPESTAPAVAGEMRTAVAVFLAEGHVSPIRIRPLFEEVVYDVGTHR